MICWQRLREERIHIVTPRHLHIVRRYYVPLQHKVAGLSVRVCSYLSAILPYGKMLGLWDSD